MLRMIGGSAVALDSSASFSNIIAYKDEAVPWLRELATNVPIMAAQ